MANPLLFLKKRLTTFVASLSPDFLKELGKWFLDVAKYVATAIVISLAFSNISSKFFAGLCGVAVILGCLVTAYIIFNNTKSE